MGPLPSPSYGPDFGRFFSTTCLKTTLFITETERKYILLERSYDPAQKAEDHQTPLVPLVCDIIKTPAVWVNMVGDFANNFGSYVLLSEVTKHPNFFRGMPTIIIIV